MTIYCNVEKCFFWERLETSHQRPIGKGIQPIGDMGKYGGRCKLDVMRMVYRHFRSSRGLIQEIAVCGNFSESKIPVEGEIKCNVFHCLWNTSPNRREGGTCDKIRDYPIYVDPAIIFDGNDKTIYPKCTSISNRIFKGHIDWGVAAAGRRVNPQGLSKRDFEPQRERIIGSY